MEVSTIQLIMIVLGSNATLVAGIVFILQKFGPNLFNWMRAKIDEKNGSIGELVHEIKRLTSAILAQIENGQQLQGQQLEAMQRNCRAHTMELEKLVKSIEEHRAA